MRYSGGHLLLLLRLLFKGYLNKIVLVVGWKIYPAYVEFYFLEPPNDTPQTFIENSGVQKQNSYSFPVKQREVH